MIGIIDYGMGNLHSVQNALSYLDLPSRVADCPQALAGCDRLLLPGVGAFPDAMERLTQGGFDVYLRDAAADGTPLLGICLGMQLLFTRSYEFRRCEGLHLIEGEVIPITAYQTDTRFKSPHMGWNALQFLPQTDASLAAKIAQGSRDGDYVYFVHSFKASPTTRESLVAVADYGEEIPAIVRSQAGNVIGMQFHPEKSERVGLQLLRAFGIL